MTPAAPGVAAVSCVVPMPEANVLGPGRDRGFLLPQYFAVVGGVRTAFFDAGRGPVVVFAHGLAGNLTNWVHVVPGLAARFRVVGLDLPGCGETGWPLGGLSVRSCADHVLGFLDVLGIERAAIVGHSLGGMVAVDMALRARDRITRLALVNPAGFQRMSLPVRAAGHLFLRAPILSSILPSVWKALLDSVFHEKNDFTRAFVRSCEETYRADDIHEISAVMAAMREDLLDRDFLEVLDRIDAPTLLVWGRKDRLTPARALRAAAATLPNVTAREIPNCGHMPIIERPDVIRSMLEDYLARS